MLHALRSPLASLRLLAVLAALAAALGLTHSPVSAASSSPGAVYSLTNATSGNAIIVFDRAADGTMTPASSFATGGLGTGSGLGSQGALELSGDNRWLFAVNAGSNSISSFAVTPAGLTQISTVDSGGVLPISLTTYGNLLYVLNAGGTGTISGFIIGSDGSLSPLAGSTRSLSSTAANAAEIGFSPDGSVLAVTEKATGVIDTYTVAADGLASGPTAFQSGPITPFGFAFDPAGQLLVSDAALSAVSSYAVAPSGTLSQIAQVPDAQAAACWVAATKNGKFAYTANAHSGTISGYSIAADGSLSLLNANGQTGVTGGSPLDMALSVNSHFLYVFNNGSLAINAFQVGSDGSLTALPDTAGLAAGGAGLAAR